MTYRITIDTKTATATIEAVRTGDRVDLETVDWSIMPLIEQATASDQKGKEFTVSLKGRAR